MSLNDILQIEKERIKRERVVITTVYDRLKNRINNSVRVKSKECIYRIPEFIPGYPLINVEKTMEYLLNKLKKEGFIAGQMNQLDIYITWDPALIRQLGKQEQEQEKENNKTGHESKNTYSTYNKVVDRTSNKSIAQKILDKEYERSNEDFINTLISSKKDKKK